MDMHRPSLIAIVIGLVALIAVLDFWTSAELIGSILFTLPLALCALTPSKWLLWGTAVAAAFFTVAAEFGVGNRIESLDQWSTLINRGLLIASFFTLTTFIHLWSKKAQKVVLDAVEIKRQGDSLITKNEQLENLLVTAACDIDVHKAAERHLVQMEAGRRVTEEALRESEERYRLLLDGVEDYAIFVMDRQGVIVNWNAGAERIKGYSAGQIVGQSFSCFFPAEDIARGRPEEILRLTALRGRHEEQGMRVRKDGSQFLASVTFTALRDQAGNLRGFSEFSHDLSESKESGEKYRGLLEAAPDAMVVVNQDGDIVLLNLQAEKQFGYHRDELLGQPVTNIIPKGFAERLVADGLRSAADALAQQIGMGIELIGQRKDGSEFPIEIMLSPLQNAEGILVTAAIRDITDRVRLENQLREQQTYLRGLVESSVDGLVTVDSGGFITDANAQLCRMSGFSREELIGASFKHHFTEPDLADAGIKRTFAEGAVTDYRLVLRTKDGRKAIVSFNASGYRGSDGNVRRIFASARDISEQARLQSELDEQQAYNRSLIEASADAFFVIAPDGIITDVNVEATRITGYTREHLINSRFFNYFTDIEQASAGVQKTLVESGGVIGYELVLVTGQDLRITVSFNAGVFTDIAGKPLGILAVARDVTERKQFERALQEKNIELENAGLAKDLFLAGMSHELRTPLNAIIGFTGTLLMKLPGQLNGAQEKQLLIVQTSAKHLLSLINDLLDLVKVESGKVALYPEPVECKSVLEEVGAALKLLAAGKGLHFEMKVPAAGLMLNTDRRSLTQILFNLTNNAIKFTENGSVSVAFEQQPAKAGGTQTSFIVEDTGVGIRAEDQSKLFQAFEQLGVAGVRRQGTGLGLHLSQKLAQLLGGHIGFVSEYGKGSRFTLVIEEA
jgi:PAS domain S-box-containing protein